MSDPFLEFIETIATKPRDEEIANGATVGDYLDWLVPPEPSEGIVVEDAEYFDGLELTLYRRADTSQPRPGVLFLHGGAWRSGHRRVHVLHCARLAERGYVAATASYRFVPEHAWEDLLSDARSAAGWLLDHHTGLGLDPSRLAVAGGSAGAHLAVMTAMLEPAPPFAACVLWYPPVDLRTFGGGDDGALVMGELTGNDPARLGPLSPVEHVRSGMPPVLTLTGDDDEVCTLDAIRTFHARLDACGVPNELVVYPGGQHGFDIPMAPQGGGWRPHFDDTTQRMLSFLERHVGAPAG